MTEVRTDEGYIRSMSSDDLELVLAWRNHPEIRRYMLTQHDISPEEHRRWYGRTSQDTSRRLLVFEYDDVPAGFVQFTKVSPGGIAEWGFYVSPDAPQGTGQKLGRAALNFGFKDVGLHKVCGQALDFNDMSIRFHHMLGFRQEGVLREQHVVGETYHDLICFGLLQHEWSKADQG